MKKPSSSFESTEAVESLGRLLVALVSDGFSPPLSYAWLASDGSAATGICREENGRLVFQPTSQWSASGLGHPAPLVGLFRDKEGEVALLCMDAEGQATLLSADAKGQASHLS
jgi:hypothetical protein